MRILLVILSVFLSFGLCAQQESLVTQFAYNKLNLNPAYAGVEDRPTGSLLIRDQWNGLDGAPKYQSLNFELPVLKKNFGLGFNVTNREVGIRKNLTLGLSYAYLVRFKSSVINIGMRFSYSNHVNDFTDERLLALDGFALDPSIDPIKETKHLLNAGVGVFYRVKGYYFGLSIPNILNNNTSDIALQSKEVNQAYLMFGKEQNLGTKVKIFPEFLLKYANNTPISVDVQIRSLFDNAYLLGVNYRSGGATNSFGESIGAMVGLNVSYNLLFGIAYDMNVSSFKNVNNGSIEAFVRYRIGEGASGTEIINPRYF